MGKYEEIDLTNQKKYPLSDRHNLVHIEDFGKSGEIDLSSFWECVPNILKAKDMQELISICTEAYKRKKGIIVGLGGHVIKCGLTPLLIDMIKTGFITGLAANGSVIVHDFEIAMQGKTSEDVASAIEDGSFGMAEETGTKINRIVSEASAAGLGLGEAMGKYIYESDLDYKGYSLLAAAYEYEIPFTIHVALGTDIVHQHNTADGKAIGDCSLRDFRIFCKNITSLNDGGVYLNFGSAVILPEVFLKAITVVRNLDYPLRDFYTAIFDMLMHYRPMNNIAKRPTKSGGKGFYFLGHHEILIPLFLLSLKEKIKNE